MEAALRRRLLILAGRKAAVERDKELNPVALDHDPLLFDLDNSVGPDHRARGIQDVIDDD